MNRKRLIWYVMGMIILFLTGVQTAFAGWTDVTPAVSTKTLFGVWGTNKGITFLTDTMGSITVTGGKSDPRGAAAALLKDIIHIFSPPLA